jgi:hypothetical protein
MDSHVRYGNSQATRPLAERIPLKLNKKIFATFDLDCHRVCEMLSSVDQTPFSSFDSSIIYPVPSKWAANLELKKSSRRNVTECCDG